MLPARELADAADGTVNSAKSRPIALPPQHQLMECGADLTTALDQTSGRIEKQLRIVDRGTVALVGTDGRDDACLLAGVSDRQRLRRRNGQGLPEQALMLFAERYFIGPMQEGEIGIVGNDGFGKGRELDALTAKLENLLNDLCRPYPRDYRGRD